MRNLYNPPTSERAIICGIILGLGALIGLALPACLPAKQAIIAAEAQCRAAESQTEPGFVRLECDFVDLAGDIVQTFTAKAPKASITEKACKP